MNALSSPRISELKVFSTSPQSSAVGLDLYVQNAIDVAQWSEEAGCEGILVYTDNSLVDPWLVSQIIIQNTTRLRPLIAVQPAYMHPYSVAKLVSSLGHLYHRGVYLNVVAGGFKNDLAALNDVTPHDKRYARLVEYTSIVMELLAGRSPVTFQGGFYTVNKLSLTPLLAPELIPGIFVSGSSDSGLEAARALGATAIKYPQPADCESDCSNDSLNFGVRVGIIARQNENDAWSIARARFPEERKGQLTHRLAMKTSDSIWHQQLSRLAQQIRRDEGPYWLVPFENYKTFCPYLVGQYDRVAAELAKYVQRGCGTIIIDIPPSREELGHMSAVVARAREILAR